MSSSDHDFDARNDETIARKAMSTQNQIDAIEKTRSISAEAAHKKFGRYILKSKIGQGGMGAVYLAFDTSLDRDVALKLPIVTDTIAKERFLREAKAAANLNHPNLCQVFDIGEIHGQLFLTMPLIPGQTLKKYVSAKNKLGEKPIAMLVRKIALAMQSAHESKIVHRDLKPGNIIVKEHKDPVILDFGLARRVQGDKSLTQTGTAMGTVSYMPPEQIRGKPDEISASCDIYSLGIILYELLTGRTPFEGDPFAIISATLFDAPPMPSQFRDGLSGDLEDICLRAIEKEPSGRFQSMAEFASELTTFLNAIPSKRSANELPELPSQDSAPQEVAVSTLRNSFGPNMLQPTAQPKTKSSTSSSITISTELFDGWLSGHKKWLVFASVTSVLIVLVQSICAVLQLVFLVNGPGALGTINSIFSMVVSLLCFAIGGLTIFHFFTSKQLPWLKILAILAPLLLIVELFSTGFVFGLQPKEATSGGIFGHMVDSMKDDAKKKLGEERANEMASVYSPFEEIESSQSMGQFIGWSFVKFMICCLSFLHFVLLSKFFSSSTLVDLSGN